MVGDEYLSMGFADVDRAANRDAYASCLTLLDGLPYFRRIKRESYHRLRLGAGVTVLDAGCGLGDDALRMAELVLPGGMVVAVDASRDLISRASKRAAACPSVTFATADVGRLPFPDGTFERCRIDRVLQHLTDPGRAVSELVRVLAPGGLLYAYDNDWGTFSVAARDRETTRRMERFWCDAFPSGWIGRYLREHFVTAGLSRIEIRPSTCEITAFHLADRVYNLRETVRRAVTAGVVSSDQGRLWIEDLLQRDRTGRFHAAHTAYTAEGEK